MRLKAFNIPTKRRGGSVVFLRFHLFAGGVRLRVDYIPMRASQRFESFAVTRKPGPCQRKIHEYCQEHWRKFGETFHRYDAFDRIALLDVTTAVALASVATALHLPIFILAALAPRSYTTSEWWSDAFRSRSEES